MHTPAPRTIGLRTTEVTYPGGTEHIRAVRADLRAVLDDCPTGRRRDLVRLRTRRQRRPAQPLPPPRRHLHRPGHRQPGPYARIEVQDNGGPWNQGMIDPARHHGLDIVRAVADEWGIDGDNTTRTIWARFDCPE